MQPGHIIQHNKGSATSESIIGSRYALSPGLLSQSTKNVESRGTILCSNFEQTDFLTQLIDAFPKGHPLKRYRGDVYVERYHLRALFSMMKTEGWTTAFLNQQLDEYVRSLDGHGMATSQSLINESPVKITGSATAETPKEKAVKWWAAIQEYDRYQQLLQQHNRHEEEDIIHEALRLLASDAAIARNSLPASAAMPADIITTLEQVLTSGQPVSWPATAEADLQAIPLVQKIMQLLHYLAAEQDMPGGGDEMLFELLHAPWFNLQALEIALLTTEVADRQFAGNKTTLRRMLYEKVHAPVMELFAPPVPEGFLTASRAIEKLIPRISTVPLPDLFEALIEATGIKSWAAKQPAAAGLLDVIAAMGHLMGEDVARNPQRHLQQWVKLMALMRHGHLHSLKDQQSEDAIRPQIGKLDSKLASRLLQRFTMNVSALNNYLHCPLEFYYRNVLRIPSPKNEAAEFGSAVHHALEQLFRKMQAEDKGFPPVETFIADFESYMHSHRTSFTQEQFNRRLEYGKEVLGQYYLQYHGSWNTIVVIERTIRNVALNGIPLKGKIDKLEFDGRTVNIVDYKTGDPLTSIKRLMPPSTENPAGTDYWRQAVFYKILVENQAQKNWKVQSAEVDFIEPDSRNTFHRKKLFITPEDLTLVTLQITDTSLRIQNQDFYTGCGKPDCHWCHFVKIYKLSVVQATTTGDASNIKG